MEQTEFRADAGLPQLSPSVSSLVERFPPDNEIPSSFVALALVELHPEYGGGRAPSLHEKGTPDRRTIRGWLTEIAELYRKDRLTELHGRLVVVGLALVDPLLAPYLFEEGFLSEVAREIREPLDDLLTPAAYDRWKKVLESQKAVETGEPPTEGRRGKAKRKPKAVEAKEKTVKPDEEEARERGLDPTAREPETLLLQRNNTAIRLQVYRRVWTLGFEAVVLPTDATGNVDGKFARAFRKDVGEEIWQQIESGVKQHATFTADTPLWVKLEGVKPNKGLPSIVFVATASAPEFSPEAAGRAATAVVRQAAELQLKSLVLPLLGSGRGGLREPDVLDSMMRAITRAGPHGSLTDITLVTLNRDLLELARKIAEDITGQDIGHAPDRAIVDNDLDTKDDSLKVSDQARTFAKLLADRDVHLPISLGLFGNWGVGKTHFMKLMQEEIKDLTSKQPPDDDHSTYMRRVAQIEFNAWHYVDTNLWASLAIRLFDGLAEEYAPENAKESEIEALRRQLRAEAESSERAKQRALERQDKAQQERQQASLKLASLEAQRTAAAKEYGAAYFKRFLRQNVRAKKWLDDAKEAAKNLGLDAVVETSEDAVRLYDEFKGLEGRFDGILLALGQRFSSWPRAMITLAVIGGVLGATALVGPALSWLYVKAGMTPTEVWAKTLNFLVRGTTLVGPAIAWAGTRLKVISKVTGYLEEVQETLAESDPAADLGEDRPDLREERDLRQTLDRLEAEIQTEEEKIRESERRIMEAQAELQRINAGGLVYDFLEERRADPEYRSRLGVISVIRQDFWRLGRLLDDWNRHHAGKRPPIERIILYIDDLDRCHPDQVVEVLQAVHLLLAFDLFAVVVAVDPRWLERSLYKAYVPDQKWAETPYAPSRSPEDFSPQNYLEKIFQIPFSLASMPPDGYERLIDSLVVTRSEQKNQIRGEQREGQESLGKEGHDRTEAIEEKPLASVGTVGPAGTGESATADGDQAVGSEKAEGRQGPGDGGREGRAVGQESAGASRKAEPPPVIEDWEQQFLQVLHPFVETPRLAKRMVNIYRLLRVRAGSMERGFANFIDRDHGDYRAVLILLALNISHPEIAGRLLRVIQMSSDSSWSEFFQAAQKRNGKVGRGKSPSGLVRDERDKETLRLIRARLAEAKAALRKTKPPIEFPEDLKVYQRWAPEVGRYSFHWHLS